MSDLAEKCEQLLELLRSLPDAAVAFSGGVDSAVVAKAACLALGDRAVAVTAVSPSLASGELEQARQMAELIGIRHVTLHTNEFANDRYLRNAPDRCYHCKTELYTQMEDRLGQLGATVILNGANLDDLGDYRPGLQAAAEHRVRSPLVECRITKSEVRALAAKWSLPVWDKPASPCLSSRVAYGEEVTPDRLHRIDQAESFLRQLGFRAVRVRYHRHDLARIEVDPEEISRLAASPVRERVTTKFRELGFQFLTLDLIGFRSGSLNALVPLELPAALPENPGT